MMRVYRGPDGDVDGFRRTINSTSGISMTSLRKYDTGTVNPVWYGPFPYVFRCRRNGYGTGQRT